MTQSRPEPPRTRREDVYETMHGRTVVDPFRWLEQGSSSETREWVEAQNWYTRTILDALPDRDRIAQRLHELLTIGDISAPVVRRGRYFFLRREGDQNQPVLFLREGRDGPERELINPNALDADGITALDWWYPSPDGHLLAYGLSRGGDEQSTLHVLDVDRGTNLPDTIANTRAASVAWLVDDSGFYYTRYPAAGDVPAGEEVYHRRVYFHRLGSDPGLDEHVFGEGRAPEDWPSVHLSPDGRHLLITVDRGWDRSDCYVSEVDGRRGIGSGRPGPFTTIIEGEPCRCSGELAGGTLFLLTNLDAPKYRLLAIDPAKPDRAAWREIVPEQPDAVLEDARAIGGRLLLVYLADASSRLLTAAIDGSDVRPIPLPAIGTLQGPSGEWEGDEAFFGFSSFAVPPRIYRYSIPDRTASVWAAVDAPVAAEAYEVRRERYSSKDGTLVPVFVVSRQGLPLNGRNPTVLGGYGGFNISMTPTFSRSLLFWLEQGGVYALPNLRGGGEFGETWHQAGMLANKQNVFDDFLAAAEHLCRARYTNPSRLAISGGSNGGLLVGAALTQRPELFRAAVCAVPLLDMLRYHRFQIARLWISEYGSPEDAEQFAWLSAYSPYHHVHDRTAYPAVLLLSGESDSRVDPLHARKMAARLQAASTSGLPILLRIERDAGHGAGRPLAKTLAEQTDVWSFVCWQLGTPVS